MKNVIKFILFLLIATPSVFAQMNAKEFEKFQLRALNKVNKFGVFVWDVDLAKKDPAFKEVFSTKTITDFVYDKLKKLKLNAVSFDEAGDLPGGPSLDVFTTAQTNKDADKVACNVILRFVQDVQLARNTKILHYSASTWTKNKLFYVDRESAAAMFFEELENMIKEFAKEYRRAN